jgi:serine/threonine protein kinase
MMYPKSLAEALAAHTHAWINHDDSKQERDLALAFIARCLTVDPQDRPSAHQLLNHPWLRDFELGANQTLPMQVSLNRDKAQTVKV